MVEEIKIAQAIIESYFERLKRCLNVDVVVVGAGPSGLTCAYYLSDKFKVCLIEKNLSLGGGIWGGGMFFNKVVVQSEVLPILEDFDVSYEKYDDTHYVVDSIELASSLVKAVSRRVEVLNGVCVEDVVIRDGIRGVVVNWSAVNLSGLHVDPLVISSKVVVDATGHDAVVCRITAKKTKAFDVKGEGFMYADLAEKLVVEKTGEVYPNLFVTGMAVASVYGLPRMGPIFGGMLLSGKRVAELIICKLVK
jgi:thiamine thiazole synthase